MGLSGKEVDERQSKLVVVKMWEVKQEDVVKVEGKWKWTQKAKER